MKNPDKPKHRMLLLMRFCASAFAISFPSASFLLLMPEYTPIVFPRINDLEEEVRDLQVQARDTEEQEQKRSREMIARMEREKQLEVENYAIRYENISISS